MPKKILISGYYGFDNFGDEAILDCLINHLKSLNITNISVLSSNPIKTSEKHGINAFYSFDLKNLVKYIRNADILISGGGSLLQDVTSIKSLIYYLVIISIALILKKEVIIFAQGIGPIKNIFLKFMTMNLLKKCTYVSLRDKASFELLQSFNIQSDLLCDPIFDIGLPKYDPQGIVGIQLRKFPTLLDNFLNMFANYIVHNFAGKKIQLLCFQDSFDLDISNLFADKLRQLNPNIDVEVLSGLSSDKLIRKMSNLEYLFAMRFHALVIALKYGIKTAAINYDVKVEKLANQTGIPLIELNTGKFGDIDLKPIVYSDKFDWSGFDNVFTH